MAHSFRPGDSVTWLKSAGGGFVVPVSATVVAVTAKRVTIQAEDPDDIGAGLCTRHVSPASLQLSSKGGGATRNPPHAVTREKGGARKVLPPANSFEARYPNIALWVQDGWIEIGRDDCGRPFVQAQDIGGLVWEGDGPYANLDEALKALDQGIAAWLKKMG